jgi:hypothetical protein
MTDIDHILAQAGLIPTPEYTQADIDAALARLAARVGAAPRPEPATAFPAQERAGAEGTADRDLAALCEAVLLRGGAGPLHDFLLPSRVPGADGARMLGCLLSLAGAGDSARFWWQYAGGAGDHASAYCLALQHRSHGETGESEWWQEQAELRPLETDELPPEEQLRRDLRVLRILREQQGRPLPPPLAAALRYVPTAVGWTDGIELPLPERDFPQRLAAVVAAVAAPITRARRCAERLPRRTGWHWPVEPGRRSGHRAVTA